MKKSIVVIAFCYTLITFSCKKPEKAKLRFMDGLDFTEDIHSSVSINGELYFPICDNLFSDEGLEKADKAYENSELTLEKIIELWSNYRKAYSPFVGKRIKLKIKVEGTDKNRTMIFVNGFNFSRSENYNVNNDEYQGQITLIPKRLGVLVRAENSVTAEKIILNVTINQMTKKVEKKFTQSTGFEEIHIFDFDIKDFSS